METVNKATVLEEGSHPASPEQLSFIWSELPPDSPTILQAVPPASSSLLSESDKLIELQTRMVKTIFFTLLGIALVAVHYFDR